MEGHGKEVPPEVPISSVFTPNPDWQKGMCFLRRKMQLHCYIPHSHFKFFCKGYPKKSIRQISRLSNLFSLNTNTAILELWNIGPLTRELEAVRGASWLTAHSPAHPCSLPRTFPPFLSHFHTTKYLATDKMTNLEVLHAGSANFSSGKIMLSPVLANPKVLCWLPGLHKTIASRRKGAAHLQTCIPQALSFV